jgi:Zn-finger nucleic acid-binding protein
MICPVCRQSMLDIEYNNIELDYCEKCKGVWFDAGELEVLLESEKPDVFIKEMLEKGEVSCVEDKRKCPLCAQKMKKSTLGQEPEVLVDVCPRAEGIWLDGGERGQLLKQLGKQPKAGPGAQKVVEFIEEVFKAKSKDN